jgi:hypothetical protein
MTVSTSQRLQSICSAVRLSFRWLGMQKTLDAQQLGQAAATFDADRRFLSARQKLFDTRQPAFRAVTAVKTDMTDYWRSCTLPYVDDGVRLIRKAMIGSFHEVMLTKKVELETAVARLNQEFEAIKQEARGRLGTLYHEGNYPPTVIGLFDVEWSFPSIQPPNYLQELHPGIYEQEQRRIAAKFEEAVSLAEHAFATELQELVQGLRERLTPDASGQRKVFRDSAVSNLKEFLDRFARLSIGGNDELETLVAEAKSVIAGVQPDELRTMNGLRNTVREELKAVGDRLQGLVVLAPRRKVTRPQPLATTPNQVIAPENITDELVPVA